MNLNDFTRLYRRKKKGLGVTGSLVRIDLKPVSAKTLRVLSHVTAENVTNAFTKIRLGVHNRGEDYYLDELTTVVANELCVSRSDILLGDGDRFFAEFTGSTTGDVLVLTVYGFEQEI